MGSRKKLILLIKLYLQHWKAKYKKKHLKEKIFMQNINENPGKNSLPLYDE